MAKWKRVVYIRELGLITLHGLIAQSVLAGTFGRSVPTIEPPYFCHPGRHNYPGCAALPGWGWGMIMEGDIVASPQELRKQCQKFVPCWGTMMSSQGPRSIATPERGPL